MDQLGVDRANIIGWSNGGLTGLCLAGNDKFKSRVEKLVVWGCKLKLTELDRKLVHAMRDVSIWSPKMRTGFESVYGLARTFMITEIISF